MSELHITRKNFRKLNYERIMFGVYIPALTQAGEYVQRHARFMARLRAALELYGPRAMVHGVTALQVMGVALPTCLEDFDAIHLLAPADKARPRRVGVVAHSTCTMPTPTWHLRGVPLLSPVAHLAQIRGTDDELVEIGDGLMRRKSPLVRGEHLAAELESMAGTWGVKRIRRVLPLVRQDTDSIMETRTRLILVRNGLPVPEVNLSVPSRARGLVYHVDMGYKKEKVAVEYDGAVHVGNREQMELDAERRRDLQDMGWMVITVTASQLRDPASLTASVEAALVTRRAARSRRRD